MQQRLESISNLWVAVILYDVNFEFDYIYTYIYMIPNVGLVSRRKWYHNTHIPTIMTAYQVSSHIGYNLC